jgi:hypothetical protein
LNLFFLNTRTPNELTEDLIREDQRSDDQQPEELDSKSSSTRSGRSGIIYDQAGNQWDAEELERKQKNPYRWFIEKQREKQNAKGPSQDEKAASAMVIIFNISNSIKIFFFLIGSSSSQCFRTIL